MLMMSLFFSIGLAIGILAFLVAQSIWHISDTWQMLNEIEKSIDRMYASVPSNENVIADRY
jgi:hypothetical protein